jgi:hypothetical protein
MSGKYGLSQTAVFLKVGGQRKKAQSCPANGKIQNNT